MSVHYRFKVISPNKYQLHMKDGRAFEGSATEICKVAIESGIQQKYLIVATNELCRCNHEIADFDSSGELMYTRKEKW